MANLIGSAPNQVPVNGMLGTMAFQDAKSVVIEPTASAVPTRPGSMVFQLTDNTTLVFKVMGSDGVIRSSTLTLA